ncbi:MAG: SAM-dependent DNA methyltransferase, partial [Proteobacteria bacterium]|nr:SAM-dependent DNA methyltransferase [Pseudomonadota bacterium]
AERDWWGDEADGFRARKETEQAWRITAEQVASRGYNLDLRNPHTPDAVSHDPDELLADYARQQQSIQSLRDQLKSILADALGSRI